MKKKLVHICTLLLVLCMVSAGSLTANAASYKWSKIDDYGHIQLINTDTGKPVKGKFVTYKGYRYYFDKKGYAATGWKEIKGDWYYFNASGAMVTETWVADHYLMKNGKMAKKRWVKDADGIKSYVGSDGKRIPNYNKKVKAGLKKNAKGTRFQQADGTYAQRQWVRWKGCWYYFYSSGYMAKKAFIGNHYVDKNGRMITNRTVKLGNYKYTFDRDGEITKKVKLSKKASAK